MPFIKFTCGDIYYIQYYHIAEVLLYSPINIAATILRHWASSTDPFYADNGYSYLNKFFTYDDLLTNLLLYWTVSSTVEGYRLLQNGQTFALEIALEK